MPTRDGPDEEVGIDRRAVLRRGAVFGGALVWTTPVVQTIAGPAFAMGSPRCHAEVQATYRQGRKEYCVVMRFSDDADCCDCIAENRGLPLPVAILGCAWSGKCTLVTQDSCD